MENKILAKIGEVEIREKDLEYMKKNMDKRLLAQFQGEQGDFYLLQELINQKLMAMEAKESGLLEDEAFQFEFESMKDNFIAQYAIKNLLEGVKTTHENVKDFYERNKDAFIQNETVKASHILVKEEEEAKQLHKQIQEGAEFEQLAREHSTCPSSKQGGDLGYFGKGQMVKEFEDAAFSMEIGQISDIVKTQFGYHIIKLVDKKKSEEQSFETIKDDLQKTVESKMQQEAYINKINSLREKYGVE